MIWVLWWRLPAAILMLGQRTCTGLCSCCGGWGHKLSQCAEMGRRMGRARSGRKGRSYALDEDYGYEDEDYEDEDEREEED